MEGTYVLPRYINRKRRSKSPLHFNQIPSTHTSRFVTSKHVKESHFLPKIHDTYYTKRANDSETLKPKTFYYKNRGGTQKVGFINEKRFQSAPPKRLGNSLHMAPGLNRSNVYSSSSSNNPKKGLIKLLSSNRNSNFVDKNAWKHQIKPPKRFFHSAIGQMNFRSQFTLDGGKGPNNPQNVRGSNVAHIGKGKKHMYTNYQFEMDQKRNFGKEDRIRSFAKYKRKLHRLKETKNNLMSKIKKLELKHEDRVQKKVKSIMHTREKMHEKLDREEKRRENQKKKTNFANQSNFKLMDGGGV